MNKIKYSDLSLKGKSLQNIDSVVQAIDNIIHTRVGERLFNRDFGSRIEDYLFEPFTFAVSRMIYSELISSINRWEKRVEILSETEVNLNPDTRSYEITLFIKIKGFSDTIIHDKSLKAK